MALRDEYKRDVKVSGSGRGVDLAKHIKTKVAGNIGKIAYVTASGRWESEAYWLNFWNKPGRDMVDMLIESLMGRTNEEIRLIKKPFRGVQGDDSLKHFLERELEQYSSRAAILLALQEQKQEENDEWPPLLVERDVDEFHRALGTVPPDSSTIQRLCVTRNDSHLRKCLKAYEGKYGSDLAKTIIQQSQLTMVSPINHFAVAESILTISKSQMAAHILNGVINRPARDALLLHHALMRMHPPSKEPGASQTTAHNALSLAAGCDSVVQEISRVSVVIDAFVRTAPAARIDLDPLSRDLLSLRTDLQNFAKNSKAISQAISPKLGKQLGNVSRSLYNLVVFIRENIERRNEEAGKAGWVWTKKEKIAAFRSLLEVHKGALEIVLNNVYL